MNQKIFLSSVVVFSATVPLNVVADSLRTEGVFPYHPRLIVEGTVLDNSLGEADLMLPVYGSENLMIFTDLDGRYASDNSSFLSGGLGFRYLHNDLIWGMYGFLDASQTVNNNNFWVINPGVEVMSATLDFHGNAYLPVSDTEQATNATYLSEALGIPYFTGHQQLASTYYYSEIEEIGTGVDAEVGYTFGDFLNTRAYVGGYYFFDYQDADNVLGVQTGVEVPASKYVSFTADYSYDDVRNSTATLGLKVTLGGLDKRKPLNIKDRMLDPIPRHLGTLADGNATLVQTVSTEIGSQMILWDHLWFFDAAGGTTFDPNAGLGNCTFENPCTGPSFEQTNINLIDVWDPGANMLFTPGTYTINNQLPFPNEIITLNSGQSMYGRTEDFGAPAVDGNRPLFVGGFGLGGMNTMSDLDVTGEGTTLNTGLFANGANTIHLTNMNVFGYTGADGTQMDPDGEDASGIDFNNVFSVQMNNIHISDIHAGDGYEGVDGVDGQFGFVTPGIIITRGDGGDGANGGDGGTGGNAYGMHISNSDDVILDEVSITDIYGGEGGNAGNGGEGGLAGFNFASGSGTYTLAPGIGGDGGLGGQGGSGGNATGVSLDTVTNVNIVSLTINTVEGGGGGNAGNGGDGGSGSADNALLQDDNGDLTTLPGTGGMGGSAGLGGNAGTAIGLLLDNASSATIDVLTIENIVGTTGGTGGQGGNGGSANSNNNRIDSNNGNLIVTAGTGGSGGNAGAGGDGGIAIGLLLDNASSASINDVTIENIVGGTGLIGGNGGNGGGASTNDNRINKDGNLIATSGTGGAGGSAGTGGNGAVALGASLNNGSNATIGSLSVGNLTGGLGAAGGNGGNAGDANANGNTIILMGNLTATAGTGGAGGDAGAGGVGGDAQSAIGLVPTTETGAKVAGTAGMGGSGGAGGNANALGNAANGGGILIETAGTAGHGGMGGAGGAGGDASAGGTGGDGGDAGNGGKGGDAVFGGIAGTGGLAGAGGAAGTPGGVAGTNGANGADGSN